MAGKSAGGSGFIPGQIITRPGDIELNAGRDTVTLQVANTGDRPIQVGSHYHFFETNNALRFDRARAKGFRLDIAAGTAVRFEPGQSREVRLVALAGKRRCMAFRARCRGSSLESSITFPIRIAIPYVLWLYQPKIRNVRNLHERCDRYIQRPTDDSSGHPRGVWN